MNIISDSIIPKKNTQDNPISPAVNHSMETLSVEEKIDHILRLLEAQTVKKEMDFSSLQNKSCELHFRLKEVEAKSARLSNKVQTLEEKVNVLQIHSMTDNLIFYNIPENPNEDCCDIMTNFLGQVMKIPSEYMFDKDNVTGIVAGIWCCPVQNPLHYLHMLLVNNFQQPVEKNVNPKSSSW